MAITRSAYVSDAVEGAWSVLIELIHLLGEYRNSIVVIGGQTYGVEVDLMSGEYGGTGKRHRTQRVQDVKPRKARGCDFGTKPNASIGLGRSHP
jgi:hypothetical protein